MSNFERILALLTERPTIQVKPEEMDRIRKVAPGTTQAHTTDRPTNFMQMSVSDLTNRAATGIRSASRAIGSYAMAHPTQTAAAVGMGLGALALKKYYDRKKQQQGYM